MSNKPIQFQYTIIIQGYYDPEFGIQYFGFTEEFPQCEVSFVGDDPGETWNGVIDMIVFAMEERQELGEPLPVPTKRDFIISASK